MAHFAERYGLFVIICLGESIVAIGVGATGSHRHLTAELVASVSLGLVATIAMWWTYFDRFAQIAEERLRGHRDPVLAAADGYSYLHLVIVAGIITFAAGVRLLVRAPGATAAGAVRLALCGGVAAYLVGHVAFRLRMASSAGNEKIAVAFALFVLYAVSASLEAWVLMAAIAALMVGLCAGEAALERQSRSAGQPALTCED